MTGAAPFPQRPPSGELVAGLVEVVGPGLRRILAPNPGIMTGPGTNTYLAGAGADTVVIDPGPADERHLEAIMAATGGTIGYVVATHTHLDHSPLAAMLHELTGAPVAGFGPAPLLPPQRRDGVLHDSHDAGFAPSVLLGDGDTLRSGEVELRAVHTPGHCSNHLCFELAGTGIVLSGDHVMAGSTVVVAPPDGDMGDYLDALERLQAMAPGRIAPGHGDMIDDPAATLDGYLVHRRSRHDQVRRALAASGPDGATTGSVVAQLYADVPLALHPVARYSVWAHLRLLRRDGEADSADPEDIDAPWYGTHAGGADV